MPCLPHDLFLSIWLRQTMTILQDQSSGARVGITRWHSVQIQSGYLLKCWIWYLPSKPCSSCRHLERAELGAGYLDQIPTRPQDQHSDNWGLGRRLRHTAMIKFSWLDQQDSKRVESCTMHSCKYIVTMKDNSQLLNLIDKAATNTAKS